MQPPLGGDGSDKGQRLFDRLLAPKTPGLDYEDELDTMANQIDKVLEPLTIIILGCLVGFLVYAIYAPIFSLGDAILPKKSG